MFETGEGVICRFHLTANDDSKSAIHKIKEEIEFV